MLAPTIDTYQEKYKEDIISLIVNIQVSEFKTAITRNDQPDLESIPSFYQKGLGNFWVAVYEGRVVGTIALVDIGNDQVALRKMFVSQEFRGKDKAIAQRLLNSLIEWCHLKKIKEIYLGTQPVFYAAHRFYEKNGFIEIEKSQLPGNFPIMKVDTKFYARKIS